MDLNLRINKIWQNSFQSDKLIPSFQKWCENYLIFGVSEKIFISLTTESGGIGDAIAWLPAFRHLKKLNPTKKLILCTFSNHKEIFNFCKYIDAFIPTNYIGKIQELDGPVINGEHSLEQHYRKHVVISNVKHLCSIKEICADIPLEYELDVLQEDLIPISNIQKQIKKLAGNKKIIAIAPAFTMYSRIWQSSCWEQLVKYLHQDNSFIVSFGIKEDLHIPNVDFDARGSYPVRYIPHLLDIFDSIFVIHSGMLHIAGINQNIKIVLISSGQWLPEIEMPFRYGKLGYNIKVIRHNCPIQKQCFENHITEKSINKQQSDFITSWQRETKKPFPESETQYLKKYICWNYCDKEKDKFECSKSITPEQVFERYKN